MKKVITYGTYDLLHHGHVKLLERAKALGDYLIVGVTADDFDVSRGKINVQQSLIERVEAIRATGIADDIIVEEYEGQKIDDIKRYNIDIFTVGSDWIGKFDYLNEFCQVIYLPRTEGISSSELRSEDRRLRLGLVGEYQYINKYVKEASVVNGLTVSHIYAEHTDNIEKENKCLVTSLDYEAFLNEVDAVFIASRPELHYEQIKSALTKKKHILCESPIALSEEKCIELFALAEQNDCVLMDAIKTAYATAFSRLLLLAKTGKIGKVVSIDATCTSLMNRERIKALNNEWKSICAWGPTALLPIFQLLGTNFIKKDIVTKYLSKTKKFDAYTKINFVYPNATATVQIGKGVKSEGDLVIMGTEGFFYVPSPWWKTEYFEVRYENPADNKRIFYQLEGEGIRNELVSFVRSIQGLRTVIHIDKNVSVRISKIIEDFETGKDVTEIVF
ncbi:MAG: adenylyltransferase/cytidyltransferase family protein [Clostridia bacterium]|nr:adenylyltransferase/cytidyltransferase family protein [Clostridia bacterium]